MSVVRAAGYSTDASERLAHYPPGPIYVQLRTYRCGAITDAMCTSTEAGPARLTSLHERELRAAFAINYLGNPGQDDRPVAPAPQL